MQFLLLQAAAAVGAPRSLGLLPGAFLLLTGEETLEVGAAFFVLSDSRPLGRQLHLHRGRNCVPQPHPPRPSAWTSAEAYSLLLTLFPYNVHNVHDVHAPY